MPLSTLVDLVKCYTPTSGQGALTLGAAVPGFLTPSTVIPAMTSGSLVSYGIADPSGNEVGQGILTLTGSVWTLTRGVTQSSNGGAPILCTGQATVALTLRAEDVFQGLEQIASGVIVAPGVAFLDLALPPQYASFRIEWSGVQFSADNENLAAAASVDGGLTFINDTNNFDSYLQGQNGRNFAVGGSGAPIDKALDFGFTDSLMNFAPAGFVASGAKLLLANQGSVNELIFLDPGSASLSIRGTSYGWAEGLDTESPTAGMMINQSTIALSVNRLAVVPPTFARANLLRFQPYGNGDANPPTSGHTMIGTYILWGTSL